MNGIAATDTNKQNLVPFYFVVLYTFLEYGRPQNLVPFLGKLRLPAFTVLMIGFFIVISQKISLKVKQTLFFVLIMCEMIIHGPIAINNYWAFMTFYVMSITFIGYCGIIAFVDTYEKFEKFINYFFITFIFLSIIGIKNKGVGIGGFIGDENDFCMALNMILPFAIFGIFMDKKKSYKFYCLFLAALFLFVIALTRSRGGFVGLVAVIGYCVIRSNRKFAFTLLVGFLGLFLLLFAPQGYWKEMGTITEEAAKKEERLQEQYGTGAQRLYAWKLGWGMFKENPILGVGQGNYPWHVVDQETKMNVQWQTRSLGGRAAHSLYFTLLPELGIVGVFLFSMIVLHIWKDLKWVRRKISLNKKELAGELKNIHFYTLAIEASVIGFLSSSVFISTLYYPNFWTMTAVMVALRNIVESKYGSPVITNG